MNFRKLLSCCLLGGLILGVSSCGNSSNEKIESSLYVDKIENLSDDFIKGMDSSQVISLEKSGVKYYDFDGQEKDVFEILSNNGINYIRVRVWNRPFDSEGNGFGGGNCDINTAVEIGKRATKYGMKLLVDFHYSDFWADPQKQQTPIEWEGMDIEEKSEALYQYTKNSLNKLLENKIDVGMVQIGNETNGKLCGETSWFNIALLMINGSKAVRETIPTAKIAVHFANPEKAGRYEDYASRLKYYNIDYDVFASSYYPYWHGTLDNLKTTLDSISDNYNKDVMVVETSYAFTTEDTDFQGNTIGEGGAVYKPHPYTIQGQSSQLVDVCRAVSEMKRGIGVCYWEGTWISVGQNSYEENFELWEKYGSGWASSYSKYYDPSDAGKYYGGCAVDNQAFFDAKGHALESLKTWKLMNVGNKVDLKADAIEDVNIICDLNAEIVLPTKVNAIMNDGSKAELDVTWKNVDLNKYKTGGVNKYTITGEAGGMEAKCYLSMVEYNYVKNYSFEDGIENWTINDISKKNKELGIENKSTDSLTGDKHVHFWSPDKNNVEFSVEQKINDLPTGKYNYSISIMGGDCGTTNIYSYVKINGQIVDSKPLSIKGYGNWDTKTIENINYTAGDEIIIGIYVKCEGSGAGAWGKIDDALLNSVK